MVICAPRAVYGIPPKNRRELELLKESDLVSLAEMKNLPYEIFRLDSLFQAYGQLRRFAGKRKI